MKDNIVPIQDEIVLYQSEGRRKGMSEIPTCHSASRHPPSKADVGRIESKLNRKIKLKLKGYECFYLSFNRFVFS